jgi:hypothetical protein
LIGRAKDPDADGAPAAPVIVSCRRRAVDLTDQFGPRDHGFRRQVGRLLRVGLECLETRHLLVERLAGRGGPGDQRRVGPDAPLVHLGHRRHEPRRSAQIAEVAGAEQQARVARLSQLVDVNEPPLEHRARRLDRLLVPPDAVGVLPGLRGELVGLRVQLAGFLAVQVALDLEPAKIDQQRPLLAHERVGLAMERRQPIGDLGRGRRRERLAARRHERHADQQHERERDLGPQVHGGIPSDWRLATCDWRPATIVRQP